MSCVELSDLEEGEILEYDTVSPSESKGENNGFRNASLAVFTKDNRNRSFELKENKHLYLPKQRNDGYINRKLKEKLKLNEKSRNRLSNLTDLEPISSEGEYKSDEDDRYVENKNTCCSNEEKKKKEKYSSLFYGAVEDIMSEIGETINRKSRCNYKKRKSKEVKENLNKCSYGNCDLWRYKIISGHFKSKKHKRKVSFCDSDSDLTKDRTEKRKKRKKRDYEEKEKGMKKLKLRDFDEMRRHLLEKLQEKKAEEKFKMSAAESTLEADNSEIQEVNMLIGSPDYAEKQPDAVPGNLTNEGEGEDELDLIKLRLIALASNRRRNEEGGGELKPETSEGVLPKEKPDEGKEEVDLDRNELLLRAEALKTALLKKHQKRLNRLKVEKSADIGSASVSLVKNSHSTHSEESTKPNDSEKTDEKGENAEKENSEEKNQIAATSCSAISSARIFHFEVEKNKKDGSPQALSINPTKTNARVKSKRKKKRLVNLKENNGQNEPLEEDDRTLRTQLLSDLMKRKSLKDSDKKSVLMDSVQAAANKPLSSVVSTGPPKKNAKPSPAVKKTALKKINVAKPGKPGAMPNFPKPQIQRIIVHLGSEDSSDEDGGPLPAASEPEGQRTASTSLPEAEREGKAGAVGDPPHLDEIIQAKYEKSVELLLSQTRKKIEGEKRSEASTFAATEAVYKHLPPSQRLEYLRLKQRIAERERQRMQKKGNPGNSGPRPPEASAAHGKDPLETPTSLGNLVQVHLKTLASDSKIVAGLTSLNGTKSKEMSQRPCSVVVRPKHEGAPSAPSSKPVTAPPRSFLLLPSSQALISKLKLLLKKIKIEKTIEENYEKEISKLKNQLSLFEKRKCEQRFKIKKLWEESMKTYKAVQGITAKIRDKPEAAEKENKGEATERSKEEKEETTRKDNEEVKEEEGKKVSDEPETELSKAQNQSEKEIAAGGASDPCLLKYDSPLQAFNKTADRSKRVDPNVVVCQFDLMGVCKDEECTYQHLGILAKFSLVSVDVQFGAVNDHNK